MVWAAVAAVCGTSSALAVRTVANANARRLRRVRARDDIAPPPRCEGSLGDGAGSVGLLDGTWGPVDHAVRYFESNSGGRTDNRVTVVELSMTLGRLVADEPSSAWSAPGHGGG